MAPRNNAETAARKHLPATGYYAYAARAAPTLAFAQNVLIPRVREHHPIDETALSHAILFHDAGVNQDYRSERRPDGAPFRHPQELASRIAREELLRLGHQQSHADAVAGIIQSTIPSATPTTIEQKMMRACHLHRLGGDYATFSRDWDSLRRETEASSDRRINREEWARQTVAHLSAYLWPAIRLTPSYHDARGASAFHSRALDNIFRKLKTELRQWPQRRVIEIGPGRSPIAAGELSRDDLYVGVDPHPEFLASALALTTAITQPNSPVAFFVPGTANALPITDRFATEIRLRNTAIRHPDSLAPLEFDRVLARDGKVVIEETYSAEGFPPKTINKRMNELTDQMTKDNLFTLTATKTAQINGTPAFRLEYTKNVRRAGKRPKKTL